MPEATGDVLSDDAGGRVRALMDELYALLVKPQHPGGLRTLSENWSAPLKHRYRGRCSSLSKGLEELRAVLAAPADESVPMATSQAIDDVEEGASEDDYIGAYPNDLLNGYDDDVMPLAVLPTIPHATQEHRKRKLVAVSSAEDPVEDMADDDQQHPPLAADGKPRREQVLSPQEEEKPYTHGGLAAPSRPTQAADRADSPARAQTRPSKRTVANGHGSGTPVRMTPPHPTLDDSQSTREGVTVGNPAPHDHDQAVKPAADAAQPISVSVPAHHGDSVPGDPTRCGYCGNTQSVYFSEDSGKIFCRCNSVYRPSTGCWHVRRTAREQHPPAPPPVTSA